MCNEFSKPLHVNNSAVQSAEIRVTVVVVSISLLTLFSRLLSLGSLLSTSGTMVDAGTECGLTTDQTRLLRKWMHSLYPTQTECSVIVIPTTRSSQLREVILLFEMWLQHPREQLVTQVSKLIRAVQL